MYAHFLEMARTSGSEEEKKNARQKAQEYEKLIKEALKEFRPPVAQTIKDAFLQGIIQSFITRQGKFSGDWRQDISYALAFRLFSPLGEIIEEKTKPFWRSLIDFVERCVVSVAQWLSLKTGICYEEVGGWLQAIETMAESYKKLSKELSRQEAKLTSFEIKQIAAGWKEENAEENMQLLVPEKKQVSPSWEHKKQGHLLFIGKILERIDQEEEGGAITHALSLALLCLKHQLEGLKKEVESSRSFKEFYTGERTFIVAEYYEFIRCHLNDIATLLRPSGTEAKTSSSLKPSWHYHGDITSL